MESDFLGLTKSHRHWQKENAIAISRYTPSNIAPSSQFDSPSRDTLAVISVAPDQCGQFQWAVDGRLVTRLKTRTSL